MDRLLRHLHWWTAALVATGFTLAWIMTLLPARMLLEKFLLYQTHKSIGLIVAALAALRLALVWRRGGHPRGVRAGLFILLLIVPLFGYLTAAASPTAVPTLFLLKFWVPHVIAPDRAVFEAVRPMHEWLAIGLIALAGWHARQMLASGPASVPVAGLPDAHPPAEPG